MRLFEHPLHPLLVHFPTALLPMDFVLQWLWQRTGDTSYYSAAYYCLWGALIGGGGALLTGLLDSIAVAKQRKPALPTLLYHAFINVCVLTAYGMLLAKEARVFPQPYGGSLWLRGVLLLLLFFGNYLGGRLIYRFGAGIKNHNHE